MRNSGSRILKGSIIISLNSLLAKTLVFLLLTQFLFSNIESAYAQINEMGFEIGTFNFTGDLSNNYNLKSQRPAASVYLRSNLSEAAGLKYGISGGMLSGINKYPNDPASQVAGESFQVYLLESFALLEFNFLDYKDKHSRIHWTPYLNFGLGIFTFFGDVAKDTQYSKIQPAIPFGFGIKYQLNKKIDLGVEASARATFFDGIDGVSSGNSGQNNIDYGNKYDFDSYYFIGFTINYTFYFIPCPYGYD